MPAKMKARMMTDESAHSYLLKSYRTVFPILKCIGHHVLFMTFQYVSKHVYIFNGLLFLGYLVFCRTNQKDPKKGI